MWSDRANQSLCHMPKMLKFLFTAFALLLSPLSVLSSQESTLNHTIPDVELLGSPTCVTKINNYAGACIKPSECNGAIYNNLCPGSYKCCVEDHNSSPILYFTLEAFLGSFPHNGN